MFDFSLDFYRVTHHFDSTVQFCNPTRTDYISVDINKKLSTLWGYFCG